MSRRKFLQQAGALTGGLLLHNQLLQAFATPYAEKLNVAVIGCGDRGTGIMSVMRELPELFNIVGICDILDFRIDYARKVAGASAPKEYKDYRKLLEDKTIQAVVIATPLNMHYPIASDALNAGKHVFLEKTMTYNIPQAIKLVQQVKQHPGQVLQVGHQYRYVPLYFKVKEMIEKGYLGKITHIDCRWDRNWNWRRPVPAGYNDKEVNWRMYKAYSGGLVAELLSHQIDFINWAFNTHPDQIIGTGGIDFYKDGRETYDNVSVVLRYNKENMIGNFGATCGNAREGYIFKLKGTKGTVALLVNEGIFYPEAAARKELETVDGVSSATKIEWNKDGGIPILKEPMKDGTWYALQDFHKCIVEKQKPVSNVITGATTAVCVHLANEAAYSHATQNWKPAYNFS
ncbi:Gfo/Idh/MocA family oxidoreductase [Paraflavitalea sp. CAU 1676]|uniref:Gfo/Idh/MocA family protein n=1 Tax=Paraflavitalea sp. CAU 1676 TaxID=3032598 RepID=UPI0023DC0E8C|nr:Gfo/Idh/MocA family oxidoreductase [Paraflavitalea sp. CAU 1676]MDF2189360.1 Gfo/Idh/MocA family oxidoreductase [Paraflavitalea sp. CAU 1676]